MVWDALKLPGMIEDAIVERRASAVSEEEKYKKALMVSRAALDEEVHLMACLTLLIDERFVQREQSLSPAVRWSFWLAETDWSCQLTAARRPC